MPIYCIAMSGEKKEKQESNSRFAPENVNYLSWYKHNYLAVHGKQKWDIRKNEIIKIYW